MRIEILAVMGLLAGCPSTESVHTKGYGHVTWADDDSGLLVCSSEGDLVTGWLSGISGTSYVNQKMSLEIWNRDGSLRRVVGTYEGRHFCNRLFVFRYMASAGYAIVDRMQVSLADGTSRWIADSGDPLPSPDGRIIAVLRVAERRVTFLDARDGTVLGGPHHLPIDSPFAAWTPRGELLVADRPPGHSAVTISLDGTVKKAARPRCVPVPARAGAVSSEGEVVTLEAGKLVFLRLGTRPDATLGCIQAPVPDR